MPAAVFEAAEECGGLELLKSEQPDIAVIEVGLPGLNGYEVARRFRAEGGAHVVLVALTGYGSHDARERSREAGFDHHLIKPVNPELLRELLSRASRHPGSLPAATELRSEPNSSV